MPHALPAPIEAPAKIIVTGGNGFIANHTIYSLLKAGYEVITTVRSQGKADDVRKTFEQLLPEVATRMRTSVVPDITAADAYTKLFADEHPQAVLHLASPFSYDVTAFEKDLMIPAVNGTRAVLQAANSTPSIKRIVHTNSFACIYDASLGMRPGYTYTAQDWCPLTYEDGISASNAPTAYRASKAVAEKTAWAYVDAEKPHFDLVSLCPAMVFGPFLDTPQSLPAGLSKINTSNALIWDVVSAGAENACPPTKGPVWIDVRDVAQAHVKALILPEAGGQRFMLAKGVYCSQEIADLSRELSPKMQHRIPIGKPGERGFQSHFAIDATKEEKLLGDNGKWRDLQQTLSDMLSQLYRIEASG